jgi:hypothetical protein
MAMESKRVEVLGMGLQATDYAGGVKLLEELAQREKPHPEPSSTGLRPAFAKKAKQEPWEQKKGEVVKEKKKAIGVK